ncbi:MAG TPA: endonuclease/exonuclease/phosphatase family protein [Polyangia bacterium]
MSAHADGQGGPTGTIGSAGLGPGARVTREDDEDLLRIATWNIHDATGPDGRRDLSRIARVIAQIGAPLVALQEITCTSDGDVVCDAAALAAASGFTWRSVPTRGHAVLRHGNALLSAHPLGAARVHDLSVPGREPRAALEVDVDWRGRRLRVVVTHLGLRAGERRRQVERLLRAVGDDAADATILLGDLNEWFLWGRPLRWLHRRFGASPAPRTFPTRLPIFALDRVWVHPRRALASLAVIDTPEARRASDHLPVVATIRLPASPA